MVVKERLTSFDVAAVAAELDEVLDGARFQKTYQVDEEEFRARLYAGERLDLVVSPYRVHLTRYPKPAPQRASNLAMAIRKRIRRGFVEEVEQHGFDRVLTFEVETGDGEARLVVEMFGEGNVAVVRDGVTEVCMHSRSFRDRVVSPGEEYSYPPSRVDASEADREELREALEGTGTDVVRALATELGLGGLYAEEVVHRAGVDKHLPVEELDAEAIEAVHSALRGLFEELDEGGDPQVVYRDGEPHDVVPLDLEQYSGLERERYGSFNEALDEFFSAAEMEETGDAEAAWREELNSLEERLEHQERAIGDFEEGAEEFREKGDAVYAHYNEVAQVVEAVRRGLDRDLDPEEVSARIEESGAEAASVFEGLSGTTVELDLDGERVEVDYREDVPRNAERLYEESKKAKEKLEGAKRAAEDTRRKIEELREKGFEAEEARVPQRRVREPERWFTEYRWFRTSDGELVVAGRNASQNEELVKGHLEKGDLFFHTDVEGAPATVMKGGQGAGEASREEAAVFALSNSSIWREGFYSGDVYAVEPEQVTKTPESGEHLPKGSFVIRGERQYFRNLGVSHCVGLTVEDETRVMGGPCSAVGEHCRYWVEVEPGDREKSGLANEIREVFEEGCDEEDRTVVDRVATQEAVARALPPGGSRMVDSWR